ncbi:MAG: hypothetical protein ACJAZ3_000772 [Sphingobacteriales bacterium]|jgi:hypothetical protein
MKPVESNELGKMTIKTFSNEEKHMLAIVIYNPVEDIIQNTLFRVDVPASSTKIPGLQKAVK